MDFNIIKKYKFANPSYILPKIIPTSDLKPSKKGNFFVK